MGRKTSMIPLITLSITTIIFIITLTSTHAKAQSNPSSMCSGPMISSFGSCLSYLSSGSNESSPSSECCDSLRSLMSNGQDCLCLIVSGGAFRVPFNKTLAISLPKACKMSGVPIECKDAGNNQGESRPSVNNSPPSSIVPYLPPLPFTSPSSSIPSITGGTIPPYIGLTPPSQGGGGDYVPTLTPPGMRPTLTTSSPAHRQPCRDRYRIALILVLAILFFAMI